ncbi:MAG: cohesin domain-containing protein [Desulfuromonadales bacterium]
MSFIFRNSLVFVITVLCFAVPSFAAIVSITPSGDSSYTVQGIGMNNVAGIQLDMTYDSASLNSPTVTQGGLVSGAMLAANTSIPGSIKIAIISTNSFSGNGQIATVSFAGRSGTGSITSANVSMIDSTGKAISATISVAASVSNTNSNETAAVTNLSSPQSSSTTTTSTASTTASTASTIPAYLGTVTLPTDLQQRADSKPTPSSSVSVSSGEPTAAKVIEQSQPAGKPDTEVKPEETQQYIVYKGISERFKQYNSSKKLPVVALLFDKKVAQTIHQEPAILLNDGNSKAALTVDIPARITSSPNFAVNGGTLVSFKQDKLIKGRWTVEVLPEVGLTKVIMTIIAGAEEFEYPLTVAPPLKTTLTLDESGWEKFLKEVGTAKAPLHDLNNDGVRDYMDEYIFVANYLANITAVAKKSVEKIPKNK